MRSLGVVALALLCVALFVFAIKNVLSTSREWEMFEQDTARLFTAIEVERIVRDSMAADNARDSIETERLLGVAERNRQGRERYKAEADSLGALMATAYNASDSLQIALGRIESLEGSLVASTAETHAIRQAFQAQSLVLARLKVSEARAWALVDSASSVIRRVPQSCRVPVVGIKCPTVVVGGVVTRQGLDVGVAFGFPL